MYLEVMTVGLVTSSGTGRDPVRRRGGPSRSRVFRAIPDAIPLWWRAAFRCDGGHRSTLMADSVPSWSRTPAWCP